MSIMAMETTAETIGGEGRKGETQISVRLVERVRRWSHEGWREDKESGESIYL